MRDIMAKTVQDPVTTEARLSPQKAHEMYRLMVRIRLFEERSRDLYQRNILRGALHLYIGMEGVAVGVCSALRADDYITSTHRGHGHCIAKGGQTNLMMAELMGKATGYCKGKGGSMHIADMDRGILGANGIVSAGLPIAAGAALSSKLLGRDRVAVSFFGDGGANIGPFHESLNFAAIWKLPVIFVCENNLYAISTKFEQATAVPNVADRAVAYNMPGVVANGNDVVDMYVKTQAAVDRGRRGEGPTLIEAKTYRFEGHNMGDPQNYRSKEEVEKWRKIDPILRFEDYMRSQSLGNDDVFQPIMAEIQEEIERAVEFARNSPEPPLEEVMTDIYAE
jgi:pyruvate dehydrogenase E1 component alpha subunit